MPKSNPFKWRHYQPEIILLCVRWYLTYPLSYREVAEMANERFVLQKLGKDTNRITMMSLSLARGQGEAHWRIG